MSSGNKNKVLKKEFEEARHFLLRLSRAKPSDDFNIIENASDTELRTLCKIIVKIVEGIIPLAAIHFHEIPKIVIRSMEDNFDDWDPSDASRKKCVEVLTPLKGHFQKLLYHMFNSEFSEEPKVQPDHPEKKSSSEKPENE